MRIDEILEARRPSFSFEFFPPRTDEGMDNLFRAVAELREDDPSFVSVTYGAGGSTRARTIEIVKRIRQELGVEAMAHLTCVGATADDLRGILAEMGEAGVENVLALRGDPPKGQDEWRQTPGGLRYSRELAAMASGEFGLCVGGACFPEVHPQAPDMRADVAYLKEKVEAGASFFITQLFFDNAFYFEFVEEARAAGIEVPIVPGIMPITNVAQIKRFTEMCGATIPERLDRELGQRAEDADAVMQLGVAHATLQCAELLRGGAPGIHFYTLNRSPATRSILAALRAGGHADRTLVEV